MNEIGELIEFSFATQQENKQDEIEKGLEIVAQEMGNILKELKDNSHKLPWNANKDELPQNKKNKKKNVETQFMAANRFSTVKNSSTFIRNKKPKYSVQKTNYHTNCEKLASNLVSEDILYKKKKINKKKNDPKNILSYSSSRCFVPNKIIVKNLTSPGRKLPQNSMDNIKSNISKISSNMNQKNTQTTLSIMQRSIYKNSRMSSAIIPVYNLGQTYVRNVNPKKFEQNMILKLLKSQAETAIREKKTFTVCGNYYAIRRALLSRGWVEKIRLNYNTYDKDKLKRLLATSTEELLDGMRDPQNGYIYERVLLSKLLGNHQVDFYWDQHNDCFKACRDSVKLTLVNKFKRGIFNYTSKQGLCESMKRAYWFQKPGFAFIRHPRSYNLSNNDEPKEFINDYKLTAAMCLLKWIVHCGDNNQKIIVDNGKVSLRIYRFACNEVSRAIRKCRHEDIDFVIEETMNHEWDDFLECYYKIVHYGNSFKSNTNEKWMNIVQNSKTLLQETEKYWPHLELDGMFNIWILKPTNGCRGEGIHLCRTLEYIFKIIRSNSTRRYIVQKYIEKPLLIYNTKFDIRQWFLISNADPLTVWIYKDCYIRFSSQLYNLHKLNEAIHLTNNSVQCRYKNCRRNSALPSCNMWDSKRFQKYLSLIGQPNVFYDTIYPGMKESLVSALLTNQYNLDTRKNCFELYGTDFMLTEDYKPWLIEINSRPALFPSTPVTARMCPQVLEDLIKVVIDNEKNPMALTGNFELLYKEKTSKLPTIELEDLKLKGEQLPPTYFYNPDEYVEPPKKQSVASQTNFDLLQGNIKQISLDMRKTLENLLSVIQVEREKRTEHRNEQLELIIATKKNDDIPNNMNNSSEKNIITLQDTKFKNSGSSSKSNFSINQNSEINLQKEVSYITTELVHHTSTEDTEEIVKIEKPLTNYNSSHSIFTGIIESIRNFSISYKKCIPRI